LKPQNSKQEAERQIILTMNAVVQDCCPSCLEEFATEPNEDLTPIMGIGSPESPCGHNICNACVLKIQMAEIEEKRRQVVNVKCPVCREPSFNAKIRAPNRGLMSALIFIRQNSTNISTKRPIVSNRCNIKEEKVQSSTIHCGQKRNHGDYLEHHENSDDGFNNHNHPNNLPSKRTKVELALRPEQEDRNSPAYNDSLLETPETNNETTQAPLRRSLRLQQPSHQDDSSTESGGHEHEHEHDHITPATDGTMPGVPTVPDIKSEPIHFQRKTAQEHRKYGDRVLLARQAMNGMMKLGGGNATMYLWPKDRNHPRYSDIGDRKCVAYNDLWNVGAPKYAGQPFAHVSCGPIDETFSVFVKRTVKQQCLGWEYCGEYRSDEDALVGVQSAHTVPKATKDIILSIVLESLNRANGEWKSRLEEWKERISQWCKEDSSPAGPKWLVDGHSGPRSDEETKEKASNAARARALGFCENITLAQLAKLLVEYDPFYESDIIEFIRYDEEIYNYVKAGETTKNYLNKSRKKGTDERTKAAAKASDWYAIYDTYVGNG
jgi:HRD ubiquitin ligase complex, ER membrane component